MFIEKVRSLHISKNNIKFFIITTNHIAKFIQSFENTCIINLTLYNFVSGKSLLAWSLNLKKMPYNNIAICHMDDELYMAYVYDSM